MENAVKGIEGNLEIEDDPDMPADIVEV